jgi:GNAT superfamily N-acetyltransferase
MTRPALDIVPAEAIPAEILQDLGVGHIESGKAWVLYAADKLAGAAAASSDNDACLSVLYVRPAWRGLGYGSEVVAVVLEDLAASGASRVRALAPAGNGLSVYFWFRQGFRPERPDERGLTLVCNLQ